MKRRWCREVQGNSFEMMGTSPIREPPLRDGADIIVFHYARADRVASILAPGEGLRAMRRADWSSLVAESAAPHIAEAFLEPVPEWLHRSPYFGDLGWNLMRRYIGNVLLELRISAEQPELFVADYAHALECKHVNQRGGPALDLGYDCRTGHQAVRAGLRSYVPLDRYGGGHVAPTVALVRQGPGIVVPTQAIRVARVQPFADDVHLR